MSLRNVALPCFQFCSAACQFNCPLISPSSIRSWLWLAHQLNTICLSVCLSFEKCTEPERVQGIAPPSTVLFSRGPVVQLQEMNVVGSTVNTQLKTTGIQRIMLLFSTSAFNGSTTQQQHRSFVLYCVDEDSWKENGWQNDHERTEFEGWKKSLFNSRSLWLWMTATRNRQLQCKTSPIHRKRVCSLLLRLPTTRTDAWCDLEAISDLVTGCSSHNRICCCGTKAHRIINRNEIYGPGVILGQQYVAVFANTTRGIINWNK